MAKVKISFRLLNNKGGETFSWEATSGEGGSIDNQYLIDSLNGEFQFIQSALLSAQLKGAKIAKISPTNFVEFEAKYFDECWESVGLDEVRAKLGTIRVLSRNQDGWYAKDYTEAISLIVNAANRKLKG